MNTLEKKIRSGSPLTKEDIVAVIRGVISRQHFSTFYATTFDDYITGVAETVQEKVAEIQWVDKEIEFMFSELIKIIQLIEQLRAQGNTQSSPVDQKAIGD